SAQAERPGGGRAGSSALVAGATGRAALGGRAVCRKGDRPAFFLSAAARACDVPGDGGGLVQSRPHPAPRRKARINPERSQAAEEILRCITSVSAGGSPRPSWTP